MAERTANSAVCGKAKQGLAALDGGSLRIGRIIERDALGRASGINTAVKCALAGCAVDAHEDGEVLNVRGDEIGGIGLGQAIGEDHMRVVFRTAVERAGKSRHFLIVKYLIGNPQLYVGCFAGEEQQGLVLGLPAKFGLGPIIAVMVEVPTDAISSLVSGIGRKISVKNRLGRVFYQAQSKGGRRDAEDHIASSLLRGKVRLVKLAVYGSIAAAFNAE